MNKQEKLKEIDSKIKHFQNTIKELETEKLKIENQKEISINDLILEFNKSESILVKKEVKQKQYDYILGGDGRSAPWDEKRNGLALDITISDLYISQDDLSKFIEYVKATKDDEIKSIFIDKIQKYPR